MKKYFYLLIMVLCAVAIQSCSDDKNEDVTPPTVDENAAGNLESDYITIENATYQPGAFPAATTAESLDDVDMSSQVMNGAMNFISVVSERPINTFYLGVSGVDGYLEYMPEAGPRAAANVYTYVIPVMISDNFTGTVTIIISAKFEDGNITAPVESEISYIETKKGDIEVKLAFSNEKDVDLHVYTPSGNHIYYGNRGGSYYDEAADTLISFGLDIDSNAACNIDGVNKENIYIPTEFVEAGTYTVVVDMYENCDTSISTSWSIVARYKGQLITPLSGRNPASGVYEVGAGEDDMTQVMTFTVKDEDINNHSNSSNGIGVNMKNFIPKPLSDTDRMKMRGL